MSTVDLEALKAKYKGNASINKLVNEILEARIDEITDTTEAKDKKTKESCG
jgi:hypothetical protein